jgi:type IV secretion system protein VirB6
VFQSFWTWLAARLASYIGTYAAASAAAIEPVAVTLGVLYVMVWGYLHMKGSIQEPFLSGAMRILTLALVFGVGLRLWSYHEVITETFYSAPVALTASIIGAADPVSTVDTIWDRGGAVAATLWERGGVFSGDMGYYLAALAVYLLMGMVCVYAMFLIALSRIALAVLLALGPIFILLLLFESTRRFFEAWLQQLTNYALVSVLTVLVAGLMLEVVQAYAEQTAARGSAILTVDALNMVLVAALVFLVFRQVMPIAARLSGGIALSSFNSVGRVASWVGAGARRGGLVAGGQLAQSRLTAGARSAGSSGAVVGAAPQATRLVQAAWRRGLPAPSR